jgi:O-antigen/teichoic acid export membrane protein
LALGSVLLRGEPDYLILPYRLIACTLPVTLAIAALRGIVQGRQGYLYINAERISGTLIRLLALVALIACGVLTPVIAAWASLLSALVGSLILLPMFWRPNQVQPPHVPMTKSVLQFCGGAAFGTIGGYLVVALDQALMIPLGGSEQLGYYAVAAAIAELPIAAVGAVRDLVFTVSAERNDAKMAAGACRVTMLVLVPTCAIAALAVPYILPLLYGRAFVPAVRMTQLLLCGTVGSAVTALLGAGLMGAGYPRQRSVILLCGAIFTVALIFLLVPSYGGMGAAWATIVTYTALACATAIAYSRSTGVRLWDCLIPTRLEIIELTSRLRTLRGEKSSGSETVKYR